jgi:hypothetical protein
MSTSIESQYEKGKRDRTPGILLAVSSGLCIVSGVTIFIEPISSLPWATDIRSLVQAILPAVLIGGILDYRVRQRFAVDIGRNAFLTLFGIQAPPKYVAELERICRTDRLSTGMEWHVDVSWFKPNHVLRVHISLENFVQNISMHPVMPADLWLSHSIPETPGSHFDKYEGRVIIDDNGCNSVSHLVSWNARKLRALESINEDGSVSVPSAKVMGRSMVPPNGCYSYSMAGTIYQRAIANIPLITTSPALRQRLTLAGDALKDLGVEVNVGPYTLDPLKNRDKTDERIYSLDHLTLAGTTIRVQWQPIAHYQLLPLPSLHGISEEAGQLSCKA